MKIHKAGYGVILILLFIELLLGGLLSMMQITPALFYSAIAILLLLLIFVVRFFRFPDRNITFTGNQIVAPADGKVVVIEEVNEDEFIKEKRIQISIFMSVWNVHINWLPVLGKVVQSLHFDGRYMAAWLPKSSSENERAVVVIESMNWGKILVKQIAGAMARRIITYAKENDEVKPGNQLGFIRFGSRVDVLIPVNSDIKVELNQKVTGGLTILAELTEYIS